MKAQNGFTLIELMVVIVIISILSALAIPKMFAVTGKAKAAEAPGVINNWEVLQSAYSQETGAAGTFAVIGFQSPVTTMWFAYSEAVAAGTATITATVQAPGFGGAAGCVTGNTFTSLYVAGTDVNTHGGAGTCRAAYAPLF